MSSSFSATLRWWLAMVSASIIVPALRITSIWRQPKRASEVMMGTGVPTYFTWA